MKLFAILGYPLDHSLSPRLMNSFFRYAGIDAAYGCFPTDSKELQNVVDAMDKLNFVGANVTIPYKEQVIPMVGSLSGEAKNIGAVNTLLWRGGCLEGHNTDSYGFLKSLEETKFPLEQTIALVFGAGGVARAVAYALVSHKCDSVYLVARDERKANSICNAFNHIFPEQRINFLPWDSIEVGRVMPLAHLIVNATPLGMGSLKKQLPPLPLDLLGSGHVVFDVIYNPSETCLLMLAKQKGAKTINGLPMLLYQAAKSLEIWFGKNMEAEAVSFWKRLLSEGRMVAIS